MWAILVSLGVGLFLAGPTARLIMGTVSVALLLLLAFLFLRGAWRALRASAETAPTPSRFDSRRASYLLGATMALSSPWNVAFWLAAIGRPEFSRYGTAALFVVVAAVIAGALTWGLLWSGSVVLLHRRAGGGRASGCRGQGAHRRADAVFRGHLRARAAGGIAATAAECARQTEEAA